MDSLDAQTILEVSLFTGTVLVWLQPSVRSIFKGQVSFLHPSFMVPMYLIFSVSVALSEHWFEWSKRGFSPGLRVETQALQSVPDLYTRPLAILLVLGFVYHFGVRLACGRAQPTKVDRIHLFLPRRLRSAKGRSVMVLTCLVGTIGCCLPYLIFGQGSGFFWTFGLYMCIPLFPLLLMLYDPWKGSVLFIIGLAEMLIFPSKQNFLYYFLPFIIFGQGRLPAIRSMLKPLRVMAVVGCAIALYYGTYFLIERRNEQRNDTTLLEYILVREYGFETFAILTHSVPLSGHPDGGRALLNTFVELVPSLLLPFDKPRRTTELVGSVMPRDLKQLPDAGFYTFFCFHAYYDYGVFGAVLYCLLFAYVLGMIYKYALQSAHRNRSVVPLLWYLPWPMFAQFWVNGVLSFGIIFSGIATGVMYTVLRMTSGRERRVQRIAVPSGICAANYRQTRSRVRVFSSAVVRRADPQQNVLTEATCAPIDQDQ